jgi:hypothetical protein
MPSIPANVTLFVFQGQTFDDVIIFIDGNDDPLDFTGQEARMQVRRAVPDQDVIVELSTAEGTIEPLGVNGVVKFALPASDTAELPTNFVSQTWVYDLEIGDPTFTTVRRMIQGAFVVSPEVTRG